MSEVILDPTADGPTATAWAPNAGGVVAAVARPDDDSTTYMQSSSSGDAQSYTVESLGAAGVVAANINNVYTVGRHLCTGGAGATQRFRPYRNATACGFADIASSQDSWTTTTFGPHARDTGDWAPEDFVAGNMEVHHLWTTGGAPISRVTTAYMKVDFTPVSGGFFDWLNSWLPPILAVASHSILQSEIVQIIGDMKVTPSTKEEFELLLNAFKVRPKFCFVGV